MNPIIRRERLLQLLHDYPMMEIHEVAERLQVTDDTLEADLEVLRTGLSPEAAAQEYLHGIIRTVPLILEALPCNREPAQVVTQTAVLEDSNQKYAMILLRSGGDIQKQRVYIDNVFNYLYS